MVQRDNESRSRRGMPMPEAEQFDAVMLSHCYLMQPAKVSVAIGGEAYHLPVGADQFRAVGMNPPAPGAKLLVRVGLAAVGQPRIESVVAPPTASVRRPVTWLMSQGAKTMRAKRGPE